MFTHILIIKMTIPLTVKSNFFDENYCQEEQLPRNFSMIFSENLIQNKKIVSVYFNGNEQVGSPIDDNSYENDFYRYHDIFHYTFATILGWSPCSRAMMKLKRKSNKEIDSIEDGARATITEEAIALMIFNEAKKKGFFQRNKKVSKITLKLINEMTENFEVKVRTSSEWEMAILKAYEIFNLLIKNNGGLVYFNMINKEITFTSLN